MSSGSSPRSVMLVLFRSSESFWLGEGCGRQGRGRRLCLSNNGGCNRAIAGYNHRRISYWQSSNDHVITTHVLHSASYEIEDYRTMRHPTIGPHSGIAAAPYLWWLGSRCIAFRLHIGSQIVDVHVSRAACHAAGSLLSPLCAEGAAGAVYGSHAPDLLAAERLGHQRLLLKQLHYCSLPALKTPKEGAGKSCEPKPASLSADYTPR